VADVKAEYEVSSATVTDAEALIPLPDLREIDYVRFRDLVLDRTGMSFGPRRRRGLAVGVLKAAGRAGHENPGDYYSLLQSAATDSELWDDLIGAITVGETYFFRNEFHMAALRDRILPELIASRRDVHRLRIWSAGCATGEEPYTIAILLHELVPDIARWNIHVLGTDINSQAIELADQAVYREPSFRRTDPDMRDRHFVAYDGAWRLKEQVRKPVSFAYLNLAEDVYPSLATSTNAMDLILCRNVAIYLPETVTRRNVARFEHCLVPDGWLIVGAAETNSEVYARFETVRFEGATVYRKPVVPVEQAVLSADIESASRADVAAPSGTKTEAPAVPASGDLPCESRTPCDRETESESVPPRDAHQEGLSLMEEGRYEEAIECFRISIASDPDAKPIRCCEIAEAFANEGRLETARAWCRRAIDSAPLFAEAYYILSIIDQEEGLTDNAITQLKKTLYLEPDSALAHFSLANVYRETNRQREAARHRRQAIRLAARMPPDCILPGSEGVTAGRLLAMARAMP